MNIIVPLAGPDYFKNDQAKGLNPSISKTPQLLHTLHSRIWSEDKNNEYFFVLKDSSESRDFSEKYLMEWFPNSKFIYLSSFTRGAAFSCLAALSLIDFNQDKPLVFDLADIYFETKISPDFVSRFSNCSFLGYSFESNLDKYSYFKVKNEKVILVAEKKVISNNASTGVYIYKNASIFLKAFSCVLSNPEKYLFNNLLYIAPVANGLISNNQTAKIIKVEKYHDYKN